MGLNLALDFHITAEKYADSVAIQCDSQSITYHDLAKRIRLMAVLLHNYGVRRGDYVAVMLPNVPEFTISYFAILHLGAVVVPCNILLTEREISYQLNNSDAKYLIAHHSYASVCAQARRGTDTCLGLILTGCQEMNGSCLDENFSSDPIYWLDDELAILEQFISDEKMHSFTGTSHTRKTRIIPDEREDGVPAVGFYKGVPRMYSGMVKDRVVWDYPECPPPAMTEPTDTAVILYTSGTTGFPKGAELSNFNLYSNAMFVREYLMQYKPGVKVLGILPLYHSFGQTVTQNATLLAGATLVMMPKFDPRHAVQLMCELKIQRMAAVPTMLHHFMKAFQKAPCDLSHLSHVVSGGSALSITLMENFQKTVGVRILEGYGLSETSPLATCTLPEMPEKPGSVGMEIAGCQVRIMLQNGSLAHPGEIGEIIVRGHNVMKGYYKNPLATQIAFANAWFHTGDLGYRDENGFLYLVDRKKDIIIRAGMNVYPREIEEILLSHPDVLTASVLGIPHPVHGEDVVGFVTINPNATITALQLLQYCRTGIAAFKCPKKIIILDKMPCNSTGKILKQSLRQMYILQESDMDDAEI